jgi:hypothetical protein
MSAAPDYNRCSAGYAGCREDDGGSHYHCGRCHRPSGMQGCATDNRDCRTLEATSVRIGFNAPDFLDTVKTKDAVEIRYCYEDGTSPLVTREEHESALADAQCRLEHAQRCHAAELHERDRAAKALDAENAELRRQVGVAERTSLDLARTFCRIVDDEEASAWDKLADIRDALDMLRPYLEPPA